MSMSGTGITVSGERCAVNSTTLDAKQCPQCNALIEVDSDPRRAVHGYVSAVPDVCTEICAENAMPPGKNSKRAKGLA